MRSLRSLSLAALLLTRAIAGSAGLAMRDARVAHALSNSDVSDFSLDTEEQAFLTLINNYRGQNSLGALTVSTNLNREAQWLAIDLGARAYFSHTDLAG